MIFIAILPVFVAAGAWAYRFKTMRPAEDQAFQKVTLDLRFTAPVGNEFCAGKSERLGDDRPPKKVTHKNLSLAVRLPERIVGLPPNADFGAKEIVFHPGKTDVDVYKHLDSGRLIHTQGTIHLEGKKPVLNVLLDMEQWPPGQYVVGIGGDPFFGYCTVDFVD